MTQKSFTIGALAKKAGVNVETIRFYQRRGLLIQPVKPFMAWASGITQNATCSGYGSLSKARNLASRSMRFRSY